MENVHKYSVLIIQKKFKCDIIFIKSHSIPNCIVYIMICPKCQENGKFIAMEELEQNQPDTGEVGKEISVCPSAPQNPLDSVTFHAPMLQAPYVRPKRCPECGYTG